MCKDCVTTKMCSRHTEKMTEKIDEVKNDINDVKVDIAELPSAIMKRMEEKFVTKDAFRPVQKLAYGGAGLILGAVLVGLVAVIVQVK